MLMNELFDYNIKTKKITPRMLRTLISEVGTTLMIAEMNLSKGETVSFKGLYSFFVQLNNIRDYHNAQDIILYYIDQLCELSIKNVEKTDEKSVDSKCGNIVEYVHTEYQNFNLNVNYLADVFGVTSNWMSKYFKNKMGVGLAEYIMKYRISKAKELLTAGYTIADVAEKCGFVSDSVFRRAFKKFEGVSPSEYRQLKPRETEDSE